MGNSELLKLIKEHNICDEDSIEITRIFEVMTDDRKVEIIDDWENIASRIKASREQLEKEKEILLIQAISDIEKDLEEYDKWQVRKRAKKDIDILKNI